MSNKSSDPCKTNCMPDQSVYRLEIVFIDLPESVPIPYYDLSNTMLVILRKANRKAETDQAFNDNIRQYCEGLHRSQGRSLATSTILYQNLFLFVYYIWRFSNIVITFCG